MTRRTTSRIWVGFVLHFCTACLNRTQYLLKVCRRQKGDHAQTDKPVPVCCLHTTLYGLETNGVQQWGSAPSLQERFARRNRLHYLRQHAVLQSEQLGVIFGSRDCTSQSVLLLSAFAGHPDTPDESSNKTCDTIRNP